jgi:hypothetical protein
MICTGGPARDKGNRAGLFTAVTLSAAGVAPEVEAGFAAVGNNDALLSEVDVMSCPGAAWLQAVKKMRVKVRMTMAMVIFFTYRISINEL